METHHLVRNVRRASLDDETMSKMHRIEADKWSKKEGIRARKIEAYHRSMSGHESDIEWIEENIGAVSIYDSSTAAVVLENALIFQDNQNLRSDAISIALDRGETKIAENHIGKLNDSVTRINGLCEKEN